MTRKVCLPCGKGPISGIFLPSPGLAEKLSAIPKITFRAEIFGKNAVSRGDFEKMPFRAESRGDCINPGYISIHDELKMLTL